MPLQAIFIDREKLILHGNWQESLRQLLRELYKYGVAVVDVSAPVVSLQDLGITYADCLMIADCEETVQQAKQWNCAVLGYEPSPEMKIPDCEMMQQASEYKDTLSNGKTIQQQNRNMIFSQEQISEKTSQKVRRIRTTLEMIVEGFEEIDFYFLERIYQRFHHLPWMILETERCYLREITLEDIDRLYELYEPMEITKYMEGLHENKEDEKVYTEAYMNYMYRFYGYGLWVVVEKSSGEIIGRAGLEHRETEDEWWLEMGYMIGLAYQKQGYATEVCLEILQYAEEALEFEEISCMIHRDNAASIRLAEKLGFHWERTVLLQGKKMEKYTKRFKDTIGMSAARQSSCEA